MDIRNDKIVADASAVLPEGEALGRLLAAVPETMTTRFNWKSGEVVQENGVANTSVERRLAVLWLSVTHGYGTMNWAARLMKMSVDSLRRLFANHGLDVAAIAR